MFMNRAAKALLPASMTDRRSGRDRRNSVREMTARLAALESSQAMLELSPVGLVLEVNPAFARLLATTEEALRGRPLAELLAPEDGAGAAWRQAADRLARGETFATRLRPLPGRGVPALLELAVTPVSGDEGVVARSLALARDVSAEVAQQQAAQQLALALDAASVALMVIDRDFVVTRLNRAAQELLTRHAGEFGKIWPGFDPARILGVPVDLLPGHPGQQRRMLGDASKLPYRTDLSVGEVKLALTVQASHDLVGGHDGYVVEWIEVTELRTQQGQLAAIDKAQAVIEFGLDGRVLHANANFLAALGYTLEEIRGQHHAMFVEPAYRQSPEYRAFWEKLSRGEYDAGQYQRIG